MKLKSLNELYIHELKDLYSAEKQLVEALPKMANAASSPDLKRAFEHHLEETKIHLERVHELLRQLNENPGNLVCKGMEGLIEEGSEVIKEGERPVKDAAMIAAAQRVEHYEMAGYGAARTHAHLLGHDDAAHILQQTLDEEGEANKKLTKLAESGINKKPQP